MLTRLRITGLIVLSALRTVMVSSVLLACGPIHAGGSFTPAPEALAGRDSAVQLAGGCDGDKHMDADERIVYRVRFQSSAPATNVAVTLRAVEADCDSPPGCAPGSMDCADPDRANNAAYTSLTIAGSPWTLTSLPANTPVSAEFDVAVAGGLAGVERIEMLVEITADSVAPSILAFRHAVNADDQSSYYSTDFPGGGLEVRDQNGDEVVGPGEQVVWSSLTAGTTPAGMPTAINLAIQSPWHFDSSSGGFRSGLSSLTDPDDFGADEIIALWGEDLDFDAIMDGACRDNPAVHCDLFPIDPHCPPGGPDDQKCGAGWPAGEDRDLEGDVLLDASWSTLGGCGWQTRPPRTCSSVASRGCHVASDCLGLCRNFGVPSLSSNNACSANAQCPANQFCVGYAGACTGPEPATPRGGAWHTGRIGSTTAATCLFNGPASGQCQSYEIVPGTTGTRSWWELLTTPAVQKVNRAIDPDSCDALARAEIVDLAWNQEIDLPDGFATFTWELDNDCAGPAVNLFDDAVVLGSVTGPYGARSGGTAPAGMGYPLFASLAACSGSGDPCVTDADCPAPQTCVWGTTDVNGNAGQDHVGANACFFRGTPLPLASQGQIELAGPPDNDLDDDGDTLVDEFLTRNGPLRNMDIRRAGGPDLELETLEDRVGDSGDCFRAAFGLRVSEGTPTSSPLAGFGLTIDDVVLEWREVTEVPDQTTCTPGEAEILATTRDAATGDVTVTYAPACAAADHALYWGPCSSPAAYSGAACSVGTSGTAVINPGSGDCFGFVVVGNDGAAIEGSYGVDSEFVERAPAPAACALAQELGRRCS